MKVKGDPVLKYDDLYALIWTTTPWTIVANSGVCFNENLDYCVLLIGGKHYVCASDLVDTLKGKLDLEVVETFRGGLLSNYTCRHPLYERESPLIHGDHVLNNQGTGLVHTAPGHGMDDFIVGKKHNLAVLCPVDDFGKFTDEIPEFKGQFVLKEGNESVIQALKNKGSLLIVEDYIHKYPYDWRSKLPIIIRCTQQWFAKLDELKENALNALSKVKFYPETGRNRLEAFVAKRNEWCISRQRVWGVPIPVFTNKDEKVLATRESIQHVISIIEKNGSNAWWTMSINDLLAPAYRNDGNNWERGKDTLDVWFDSGSSWFAALKDVEIPVDLYLEGSDQHRGWFQSSLLTCTAMKGTAPYKALLTHGFVLDQQGKKMSKSLGNVIDPGLIIDGGKDKVKDPAYGADVLRLWIMSSDFTRDILVGRDVIALQFDFYKKIRNTARFILGNMNEFTSASLISYQELRTVDKYILSKVSLVGQQVSECYENYEFAKIYQLVRDLVFVDFSAFYLDIIKDRLYAEDKDSLIKRSAQTTLHHLLDMFVKMISPFLPHLAEEIYSNYPYKMDDSKSVFLSGWIKSEPEWIDLDLIETFSTIFEIRTIVNRLIEQARADKVCGSSLEVSVEIITSSKFVVSTFELEEILNVSQVDILSTGSVRGYSESHESWIINVFPATKKKCVRCWKFTTLVEHTLCPRCIQVLK